MPIWAIKITAKLLLGRIPYRHSLLRKLGMFKHGSMDNISYAHKIFRLHFHRAYKDDLPTGFTALELGPGDSLASVLIAKAYGAGTSYHIDVGRFATNEIDLYKRMNTELYSVGLKNTPDLSHIKNIPSMLDACNAKYLTEGLDDLKEIPSDSVDFIWSHSVLEHIRKKDYQPTMQELYRILKRSGKISHNVDLQDHLDSSLNNLRFSEKIWENNFFAASGFYTNRIGYTDSLQIMRSAGFKILEKQCGRWKGLPINKSKLHPKFKEIDDNELCIRTYSVLLEK